MKKLSILLALIAVPPSAAQALDPDALARAAASWDYGQARTPLDAFDDAIRASFNEPTHRPRLETALLSLLSGQAMPAARDYACRQLSLIGGDRSVPALAGLLADAKLGSIALYAIERIPGKAAANALLAALSASTGHLRIALINALARRGVPSPLFRKWLNDSDAATASAAADALAATGASADIQPLLSARKSTPSARDAALRLAERLGPAGRPVYAELWKPSEPVMTRVAALVGLARLDGRKALPTILEAVKAPDPPIQAEAIRLAARYGGQPQLLQALPTLAPPIQVKVLTALSEAGAASALPAFRTAALSPDEAVRTAAIRALGVNGGPVDTDLLARKAAETEGPERDEARSALVRLRGAASDAALVKAIPAAEPKLKVELIRAASERGAQGAAPEVLAAARSNDRDVRREAYRALREIAPAQSVPDLVALLAAAPSTADRREMERTLAAALRRYPQSLLAPVEREYSAALTAEAKASLLSVMGQSAREDALPQLRAALALPEPALRRAAILALSEWPSPSPGPDLLNTARADSEAALKVLAVRGYIRLVSAPSELNPADVARQLAEVLKVNPQPDEKKALLAALPRFVCRESLEVAKSLTADPAVAAEARAAVERLERALTFRR